MKKCLFLLLVTALIGSASQTVAFSAPLENQVVMSKSPKKKEIKRVVFQVELHCKDCVEKINENIGFEKGVKDLVVSLEKNTVTVVYDASKTNEEKLAAALKKIGYLVKVIARL